MRADLAATSDYKDRAIVRAYKSGTTVIADLMEEFGVSRNKATRALKGVRTPRNYARLTPEKKAEMVEAYKGGASLTSLRTKFKVGNGTPARVLRKAGVLK